MIKARIQSAFAKMLLGAALLLSALLLPGNGALAAPFDPAFIGNLGCQGLPSIGQAICNVILSSQWVPGLISGVAYMIGLVFGVVAIFKLKNHVLTPDRVSIWESIKYFAAGGALFALPIVTESVYTTISGSGAGLLNSYTYSGFNGAVAGVGLDVILIALVTDLWQPLHLLLAGFAYLAGLVFVMIGILRLVKTAQDGPRGPGGFGTIMTFLTAGVLFSLDRLMGAFSNSMFGDNSINTIAVMSAPLAAGMTVAEADHVHAVMSAILGFVALVGWISFIRGWFIVRDIAEGNQQASMMAAVTHIFGGALAVNLGPLLSAIQFTLGIQAVGIGFI